MKHRRVIRSWFLVQCCRREVEQGTRPLPLPNSQSFTATIVCRTKKPRNPLRPPASMCFSSRALHLLESVILNRDSGGDLSWLCVTGTLSRRFAVLGRLTVGAGTSHRDKNKGGQASWWDYWCSLKVLNVTRQTRRKAKCSSKHETWFLFHTSWMQIPVQLYPVPSSSVWSLGWRRGLDFVKTALKLTTAFEPRCWSSLPRTVRPVFCCPWEGDKPKEGSNKGEADLISPASDTAWMESAGLRGAEAPAAKLLLFPVPGFISWNKKKGAEVDKWQDERLPFWEEGRGSRIGKVYLVLPAPRGLREVNVKFHSK